MAANEEGDETAPRGNEWEVVSLTASVYAAAPGPEQISLSPDSQGSLGGENVIEASNPMFVSTHFIFPPSQHENLPLEPEINEDEGTECGIPLVVAEEGGKSDVSMEELMSDFDEKDNKLSASSVEFEKDDVFAKEKSISRFQSSHFEATTDKFDTAAEGEWAGDVPLLQDNPSGSDSGENYDCRDLPCEAWWKRRAVTLYAQAKETNSFWSIFVAATVMGVVIIGHRWHQERWQVLQLKGQAGVSDH